MYYKFKKNNIKKKLAYFKPANVYFLANPFLWIENYGFIVSNVNNYILDYKIDNDLTYSNPILEAYKINLRKN